MKQSARISSPAGDGGGSSRIVVPHPARLTSSPNANTADHLALRMGSSFHNHVSPYFDVAWNLPLDTRYAHIIAHMFYPVKRKIGVKTMLGSRPPRCMCRAIRPALLHLAQPRPVIRRALPGLHHRQPHQTRPRVEPGEQGKRPGGVVGQD